MHPDTWGVSDFDLRCAIYRVWARLPDDVQAQLKHVKFVEKPALERNAIANAGHTDIWIRPLRLAEWACFEGVLLHELGHIATRGLERVNRGEISVAQSERLADLWVERLGFKAELQHRRALLGH